MQTDETQTKRLAQLLERERLPHTMLATIANLYEPLASQIARLASASRTPFVVGICGPQGSGKSTLAAILRELLNSRDTPTAILALDDLYLTRAAREQLAREVHPLLRTRGVPGTHDVSLGMRLLEALGRDGSVAMPSFDKSADDRRLESQWPHVTTPVRVVLFEGWCVGARAQHDDELIEAVNELERECDANSVWRRYVNERLRDEYQRFFARIDWLTYLQPRSFEVVYAWRTEQERKLRERVEHEQADASAVMDEHALRRFIAHYERLTRHLMNDMPTRANVLLELGEARQIDRVRGLERAP